MYSNGEGVRQNGKEAAKWYKKVTEGYASAQNNLAKIYHDGDGVLQDYKEAAKWWS